MNPNLGLFNYLLGKHKFYLFFYLFLLNGSIYLLKLNFFCRLNLIWVSELHNESDKELKGLQW